MKLIKTSVFSAIITFIRISLGFVVGKLVAMLAGPSGVALIGQFTNFITVVLTFANGAINTGVVKYTAEYEDDQTELSKLFSTSFKISVYCSLFVGCLLLIFSSYLSTILLSTPQYANPIKILGLTIIFYSLNSLIISIINGKKEIGIYTKLNIAGSLTGFLLSFILIYFYNIQGGLYALVLSQSIVFFVTLGFLIKSKWFAWSLFTQKFDKKTGKLLIKFSLMAIISAITGPSTQIILRRIVTDKLGIDNAGYWQGVMRISDGYLMLITTSLATYYLPKLSSIKTDGELRKEVMDGYKIIVPVVFVSCIAIFLLRNFIIYVLYTPSFHAMEKLFLWQLIGDFFKIAAYILSYVMLAKAMTRVYIITEIIFSISYVALGYICINMFSLQGITLAFGINYILYFIVMAFIFRKLLSIKPIKLSE